MSHPQNEKCDESAYDKGYEDGYKQAIADMQSKLWKMLEAIDEFIKEKSE